MTKRILILALALATLFVFVAPVFAESTTTAAPYTIMYVYTDDGKSLNVRSTPYVGDNIISHAYFGEMIKVTHFLDNGWARIIWNLNGIAYVQSRYLQWTQPDTVITPYVQTPVPTAVPTAAPTAAPYINPNYGGNNYGSNYNYYANTYTDTLAVLNAEFRTARIVAPTFTVIVRPTRASGWVNMRWAPSKDVEVLATYRNGARLTVIAETQSWYQVVDPDTEATGYMMKTYTTRQY